MTKKNDYYEDFLKASWERDRIVRDRKRRQMLFSLIISTASLLTLITFSLTSETTVLGRLNTNGEQKKEIQILKEKIEVIQNDLDNFEESFSVLQDPSLNYLDTRLSSIEKKNEYLYTTILETPDTAITPMLLRKEQEVLDEKIDDLKKQVDKTNGWLLGILATLVVAMVLFLGRQIWTYFSSGKASIKE